MRKSALQRKKHTFKRALCNFDSHDLRTNSAADGLLKKRSSSQLIGQFHEKENRPYPGMGDWVGIHVQ